MHFVDHFLGWCPDAHMTVRNGEFRPEDEEIVPPGSGLYKDRAIHWLALFRNQIMLLTIGTISAGFYLFAGLGGISLPHLFLIGLLAGLPFSATAGFLYWRKFNEVLCDGPVVLLNRFDKASGVFAVMAAVIILYGQIYFLTGLIPWFDATATNAFFGGFIAISFLGLLISTWKWESDTHRQLYYDGMILELEKKEMHALR